MKLKNVLPEENQAHVRREPYERILHIHRLIGAGKYPNSSRLALELEVSRRTIKRDLEFMRDHFNLPMAYDERNHGFRYTSPVNHLPGESLLTEAETFALLLAEKVLVQYQGLPLYKTLEAGFKKLRARLDNKDRQPLTGFYQALSFHPVGVEEPDVNAMSLLASALAQRRAITFDYRKPGDPAPTPRQVLPYHVACVDNRFYLLGHDTNRGDLRTFAINRMSSPALTDQTFDRPPDFDPDRYLRSGFAVMPGRGDYEVVIEFDSWATDIMRGRRWHPTQEITEVPGGSRFRVRIGCLEEVERWILSWGTHATVIRPTRLAATVAATARAISAKYEDPFNTTN